MPRTSPYAGLACLLSVLLHATMTNAVLTPMRIGGHGKSKAIMHALRSAHGALGAKNLTTNPSADISIVVNTQLNAGVENMSSELEHTHSSVSNDDRANATTAVPRRGLAEVAVVFTHTEICPDCDLEAYRTLERCDAAYGYTIPTGYFITGDTTGEATAGHLIVECMFGFGEYGNGEDLEWCSLLKSGTLSELAWSKAAALSEYQSECSQSVVQNSGSENYGEFTTRDLTWFACDQDNELVAKVEKEVLWNIGSPGSTALSLASVNDITDGSKYCDTEGGTEILKQQYTFTSESSSDATGTRAWSQVAGAVAGAVFWAMMCVCAAVN